MDEKKQYVPMSHVMTDQIYQVTRWRIPTLNLETTALTELFKLYYYIIISLHS